MDKVIKVLQTGMKGYVEQSEIFKEKYKKEIKKILNGRLEFYNVSRIKVEITEARLNEEEVIIPEEIKILKGEISFMGENGIVREIIECKK